MEQRKAQAMAATITLIVASGFVAFAATSHPSLLGLGGSAKVASAARKTGAKTVTVNQITYVDDTVVVGDSSTAPAAAPTGSDTAASAAAAATTGAPAGSTASHPGTGPGSNSAATPPAGTGPAGGTSSTTASTTSAAPTSAATTSTIRAPAPTAPPTTAALATTTTTTAPATTTTTVALRTTISGQVIPASWQVSPVYQNKPIPPYPAGCKNGQLEDNGAWNCQ